MKKHKVKSVVIMVALFLNGCGGGEESEVDATHLRDAYPAPWIHEENSKINDAFWSNNISGCGRYKYREHSMHKDGRFIVYCENEESLWDMYWVRDGGDVVGPEKPSKFLEMTIDEALDEDRYVGLGEVGVVGRWVDNAGPALVAIQMNHDGGYVFHRRNSDGSKGSYSLRKDDENTLHRDDSFGHKYRIAGKRLFLLDDKGLIRVIEEYN